MKKRERILLIVVGVMAAVWLGYSKLGAIARGPFAHLDDRIGSLQQKRDDLAAAVETLSEKELEWQRIGRTTIADNVEAARRLLDQQLKDLIVASGVTQVSLGSASITGRDDDIQKLTVPLVVEGGQKNITDFLVGYYNRLNFPAQLREFALTPTSTQDVSRLRLSAKAQTIVLPAVGRVGKVAGPAPEPIVQLAMGPEAYDRISQAPIWEPYKPPPLPPQPVATQPVIDEPPQRVVIDEEPPKRDESVIVALLAGPGTQEIRTRGEAPKPRRGRNRSSGSGPSINTYKLGDRVGDGELVFVHPHGAVIRIGETEYLYPIGAAITSTEDRYPVEEVPAVRDALKRLRESETPTSQPAAVTGA
jgi:hypothetical protein